MNILIPIPIYHSTTSISSPTPIDTDSTPQSPRSESKQTNEEIACDLQRAGYHNDRTPWTEEEDLKLLELCKTNDKTWNQISKHMPERTPKMCYSRYRRLTSQTKEPWKTSEDQKIRQFVEQNGLKQWSMLAKELKGRTAKQLEQHYHYCLRPEINRSEWTLEQDLDLISLMRTYGRNWKALEEKMNGRTQQQIKNRYFGRLKKLHEKKMHSVPRKIVREQTACSEA